MEPLALAVLAAVVVVMGLIDQKQERYRFIETAQFREWFCMSWMGMSYGPLRGA